MRIAILLLNKGRGSGEVARQHAHYLINQGHKVYFLHPEIGGGIKGAVNIDIQLHTNIKPVHEYLPSAGKEQKQVARMTFDEMANYMPDYENALSEIIDDVDIVIGHHANLSAVVVHNVCTKNDKPYVLFLHGTGIEPRHEGLWDDKNWALIKNAIVESKGILVTTEYVRDELVKPLIALPDDKFLVLPCGVELKEFSPGNTAGINEKYDLPEQYVICPGALTISKGPQNVVEASKKYSELAETIFIGDGELKKELAEKIGDRGRFLGFVSSEDKAKLINAATILTAGPEKKEHFGIIYTEAMAGGTPVVAYEGGGVNSIIGENIGILSERSPDDLGEKIKSLLEDPEKRKYFSIEGRKKAEITYDYNQLVKKLTNWMEDFL